MATAMASANMDDLIGALSGNVHVSQDGYDIKALQEYLAATISMPNVNLSPTATFRPLPSSRSASSSRKHGLYQPQLQHAHAHGYMSDVASSSSASTAYPGSYPAAYPAYPSPSLALSNNINGFWNSAEDVSIQAAMQKQMVPQRPGALRRTSSYSSYPAPAHAAEGYSFGDDAFAPLYQQPATGYEKPNPWAGFNGTSSAFGFGQKAQAVQEREQQHQQQQQQQQAWGREEDDEMMDEDWAERDVDELDDESSVEEVMGIGGAGEEYDMGYGAWERGRRKD